jgi:hypothetical protein
MNEAQQLKAIGLYKGFEALREYGALSPIIHACEWDAQTVNGKIEFARCVYITHEGRTRRADFVVRFPVASATPESAALILADGTTIYPRH